METCARDFTHWEKRIMMWWCDPRRPVSSTVMCLFFPLLPERLLLIVRCLTLYLFVIVSWHTGFLPVHATCFELSLSLAYVCINEPHNPSKNEITLDFVFAISPVLFKMTLIGTLLFTFSFLPSCDPFFIFLWSLFILGVVFIMDRVFFFGFFIFILFFYRFCSSCSCFVLKRHRAVFFVFVMGVICSVRFFSGVFPDFFSKAKPHLWDFLLRLKWTIFDTM